MQTENMTPQEVQNWCDNHPDYAAYKLELETARRKAAQEKGISYEDYMDWMNKVTSEYLSS